METKGLVDVWIISNAVNYNYILNLMWFCSVVLELDNKSLSFDNAKEEHSGIYTCVYTYYGSDHITQVASYLLCNHIFVGSRPISKPKKRCPNLCWSSIIYFYYHRDLLWKIGYEILLSAVFDQIHTYTLSFCYVLKIVICVTSTWGVIVRTSIPINQTIPTRSGSVKILFVCTEMQRWGAT